MRCSIIAIVDSTKASSMQAVPTAVQLAQTQAAICVTEGFLTLDPSEVSEAKFRCVPVAGLCEPNDLADAERFRRVPEGLCQQELVADNASPM